MSGRVTGKVALVTGAGSGIGRAVAIRLAEEGARVVVTSRTEAHVRETCALIGDDAVGCVLDLRDRESIEGAVARVTDAYARLDVLVCVAGVDQPSEPPVAETTDEEWEEVFAVNVTAVLPVTPSNVGVFQFAVVTVLSGVYGVSATAALGYGIILQAVELATAVAFGLPALIGEGLSWRDVRMRALSASPVELAPSERAVHDLIGSR